MDDKLSKFKNYLDNRLEQQKSALNLWLEGEKKKLNNQVSNYLKEQIVHAEKELDAGLQNAREAFEKQALEIERRRAENPQMKNLHDEMDKTNGSSLEKQIIIVERIWRSFIESCISADSCKK